MRPADADRDAEAPRTASDFGHHSASDPLSPFASVNSAIDEPESSGGRVSADATAKHTTSFGHVSAGDSVNSLVHTIHQ